MPSLEKFILVAPSPEVEQIIINLDTSIPACDIFIFPTELMFDVPRIAYVDNNAKLTYIMFESPNVIPSYIFDNSEITGQFLLPLLIFCDAF